MVDKLAPTLTVTSPVRDATYQLNASVAASYSCVDGGSGLQSCQGPVPSGSLIDTSSIGLKTFDVFSRDNVGNTATFSATYNVVSGGGGGANSADLSIQGGASPNKVAAGDLLNYTIVVNNLSKNTAQGVIVSDPLPPGTVFFDAGGLQWPVTIQAPPPGTNGTVTVNLGSVGNNDQPRFFIRVTITQDAPVGANALQNTVSVSAATQDLSLNNNTATVKTTVTKPK